MQHGYVLRYLKMTHFSKFSKFKIQILRKAHLGFWGSFDMLLTMLTILENSACSEFIP